MESEIWRGFIAGFDDGGKGPEPRSARNETVEPGKDKEMDYPLELP